MPSSDPDNQQRITASPKPFSLTLSNPKSKPASASASKPARPTHTKPRTSTNPATPRPIYTSLHDSDDDDPHPHPHNAQPELVSAFDSAAGGAISVFGATEGDGRKRELVIAKQKNRDWREESRRKRGRDLLPREVRAARDGRGQQQQQQQQGGRQEVVNGGVQAFGLSFVHAQVRGEKEGEDGDVQLAGIEKAQVAAGEGSVKPKTEDELALEALLGDGASKKSTMVLPLVTEAPKDDEDGIWGGHAGTGINEDDAFRSDVASRPDSSSLEDYVSVPVEEFGAALLRGMGWKEGEVVGKRKEQVSKPRILERRPALLGIGAKEVPGGVGDEIGAWGRAAKGRRKVEKSYTPVLLRNSKTGEMVTEEELKAKKEEQVRGEEEEDWRARRERNLLVDRKKKSARSKEQDRDPEREREPQRERDRRRSDKDRDHESSRSSTSRRHRSQSPERRHRRNDDYDSKDRGHRRRGRDDDSYDSSSSRHGRQDRERYDHSSRRSRQEVY